MFTQLIASRPERGRQSEGTAMSLLFHAALLTGALAAGAATDNALRSEPGSRVIQMPVFQPARPAPPTRAPSRPAPTTPPPIADPVVEAPPIPTVSEVPSTLPPVSDAPPIAEPTGPPASPSTGDPTGTTTGESADPFGGALGLAEVEEAATLLTTSAIPRYPEMLKSQRIEGSARLRFVVGTNGRVEMGSVVVVEASHPAFAEAVRSTLPRMRFRAARVGGRPTRQLMEYPVVFRLRR